MSTAFPTALLFLIFCGLLAMFLMSADMFGWRKATIGALSFIAFPFVVIGAVYVVALALMFVTNAS